MSFIVVIAALAMGFVLGLLGGGGSIMAVPILVYLVGMSEKVGIATSLLVVGATSAIAAGFHARAGNVAWRTGLIFGAFAMLGAYLGGKLAKVIPGEVLLAAFALIMLVSAGLMLRRKKPAHEPHQDHQDHQDRPARPALPKLIPTGLGVGLLTGMVGAGGGFVIVPALVVLAGMPMRRAIGTSLAVIALNSFAGFAGYLSHVEVDFTVALTFIVASVLGTILGTWASHRVDASKLRTGFAYFVLIAGALILGQQLKWSLVSSSLLAAGVLLVAILFTILRARLYPAEHPRHAEP